MVTDSALNYYFIKTKFVELWEVIDDKFVYLVVDLLRESSLNHLYVVVEIRNNHIFFPTFEQPF